MANMDRVPIMDEVVLLGIRTLQREVSHGKTVRASDLKMDLGKEAFSKLVLECLLLLSPEEIGDMWVGIPRRHIDASTRVAASSDRDVSPDRHATRAATPKKGLAGLSALASATPCKAGVGPPPGDRTSEEFATWATARIQADVDGLSLDSLEVKSTNRFPCKVKPGCFEDSSSFGRDEPHLPAHLADVNFGSPPAKSLKRLCDALNLDVRGKDTQVPEVLARLRGPGMYSFSLWHGFMLAGVVAILVPGPRQAENGG
eukprot:s449_g36.t1